jgi:hypothetical protein
MFETNLRGTFDLLDGPCQLPEKLIPLMITHTFDNKLLPP